MQDAENAESADKAMNAEKAEKAKNAMNAVTVVNVVNTENVSWRESKGHHLNLLFSQKLLYIWQMVRRQHLHVVHPLVLYYAATPGWLVLAAQYKTKATGAQVFVKMLL